MVTTGCVTQVPLCCYGLPSSPWWSGTTVLTCSCMSLSMTNIRSWEGSISGTSEIQRIWFCVWFLHNVLIVHFRLRISEPTWIPKQPTTSFQILLINCWHCVNGLRLAFFEKTGQLTATSMRWTVHDVADLWYLRTSFQPLQVLSIWWGSYSVVLQIDDRFPPPLVWPFST